MSFSRAQQPEFRLLVKGAWAVHCRAENGDARDKAAERSWYERQLAAATGKASSSACNAGRDYDLAMAHFEACAGAGLKWNLRLYGGDAKRMLHEIHEVAEAHGIDEDYLRGCARRALGLGGEAELPELHTLPRELLIQIVGEVKRFVRRRMKREQAAHTKDDHFSPDETNRTAANVGADTCPF